VFFFSIFSSKGLKYELICKNIICVEIAGAVFTECQEELGSAFIRDTIGLKTRTTFFIQSESKTKANRTSLIHFSRASG